MQKKSQADTTSIKKENPFFNIGFNILLPIFVLNKGQSFFEPYLTPFFENTAVGVLMIALLFPIGYFIYDYYTRSKYNFFSILGLISVLLTGGIGIWEIPTKWFAIKEAAIPLLLGIAVVVSLKTPWPLVRTLLYNPELIHVAKVQEALQANGNESAFEALLKRCTWLLAVSFLLSSILNYFLARWLVISPGGTDAFNSEVSRMMFWSWPVIVIPSLIVMMLILWTMLTGIRRMTHLDLESILAIESKNDSDESGS